jgi:hypothetical protein
MGIACSNDKNVYDENERMHNDKELKKELKRQQEKEAKELKRLRKSGNKPY